MDLSSTLFKNAISDTVVVGGLKIPRYTNEFWTSRQRQGCSLHEVSYRACFKPQLPRFFIELFTKENDVVYDPFSGRGTSVIEAGLLGRQVIANDLNPLSKILCRPRFFIPDMDRLKKRLYKIDIRDRTKADIDLSMFYHPETESEIVSLKKYLDKRRKIGKEDFLDKWIRMVSTNRLTGHSKGFFSVYTLPPNQAVSPERQIKINKKLKQKPGYRDTREIILRKTEMLLRGLTSEQIKKLNRIGKGAKFLTADAQKTAGIRSNSVHLTITSPHFLDIIDYSGDNWLRCWFNSIDGSEVDQSIKMSRIVRQWEELMRAVFIELFRVTKAGGWVAFEVGEVRNGTVKLDELLVPIGVEAGFHCEAIVINSQQFTKTSNIWGVKNNRKGTNSNRIVVFHKQ